MATASRTTVPEATTTAGSRTRHEYVPSVTDGEWLSGRPTVGHGLLVSEVGERRATTRARPSPPVRYTGYGLDGLGKCRCEEEDGET